MLCSRFHGVLIFLVVLLSGFPPSDFRCGIGFVNGQADSEPESGKSAIGGMHALSGHQWFPTSMSS